MGPPPFAQTSNVLILYLRVPVNIFMVTAETRRAGKLHQPFRVSDSGRLRMKIRKWLLHHTNEQPRKYHFKVGSRIYERVKDWEGNERLDVFF